MCKVTVHCIVLWHQDLLSPLGIETCPTPPSGALEHACAAWQACSRTAGRRPGGTSAVAPLGQGHTEPMVLVYDKPGNAIGILQTKLRDREGHEARRVGLETVPLDQHIEGGHGERQTCLKVRPAPVHDL